MSRLSVALSALSASQVTMYPDPRASPFPFLTKPIMDFRVIVTTSVFG